MNLYVIERDFENDKFIFARSYDHAAEQFTDWLIANEVEFDSFSIARVTIASQVAPRAAQLRIALALAISGIGSHDERTGWSIRAVGDERTRSAS
jgi:hypothetical protein